MSSLINYSVAVLSGAVGGAVSNDSGLEWWQTLLITITPTLITTLIQLVLKVAVYILENKGYITKERADEITEDLEDLGKKEEKENNENL